MGDTGTLGNREVMDDKLYAAARHGDLVSFVEEARKMEIESGRSEEYFLSRTEDSKENILHLAISYEQKDFIEKVLKGGELLPRAVTDQLIKQQDFMGETPLHYAVWEGNIKFFKLLFEYQQEATVLTPVGMALSLQNKDGYTPLHLALIKGKDEVATFLAKHYPDFTLGMKNNDGNTPLHIAVVVGNVEFFKLLFELYQEGQPEVTALTSVGPSLSMQNCEGNTPLHLALIEGQDEVATLLAKHSPSLSMKNKDGNTPLHLALIEGKDELATLLAKHSPSLSMRNEDGNTPLHVAAEVGNTDCFKLLLEYDHNQALFQNAYGNTPLHVAFVKLRDEIANLLLEQHPELTRVTNNMKETPLHLAVQQYRQIILLPVKEREAVGSKYLRMIKLMIEKESSLACMQDATGATPLHRAASITSAYTVEITRLMVDHCPQSVEVRDNSDKTILHLLKTIPSYEVAKDLLGVEGLLGLINHQDKQGNTPLHWAAMNLNYNMARALLNFSAERSIINNDGIAAEALVQEQFEVIMEKKQMTMEVCEATERANVFFLKKRLHQFGMIFLFPRDSKRRNILHKLMQLNSGMTMIDTGFLDLIKQVLESFPELICQVDLNGDTPLHILMQNSPYTMIPFFSESYSYKVLSLSDPNSYLVEELLELFCLYFNKAQEEACVYGGRYDPPWLVQNAAGNTPIHEALRVNHGKKVVKQLLELDAVTANLTNNLNETPLHLLVEHPREEEMVSVIEELVEANKKAVYTYDKFGLTPILRAAQHGKLISISELYKYSESTAYVADEKCGQTMWHLLLKTLPYTTEYLLKNHQKLRRGLMFKDYNGNTPLHLAIEGRHFEHAINFLRDAEAGEMGKLLESRNVAGITPSDLIRSSQEFPNKLQELLKNHALVVGIRSIWDVPTSQIQEYANTMGVVAALITTITFTAAFTVPGGNVEGNKGFPALISKAAFQAFMISNILAMCLSMTVLFCLLWVIATTDKRKSVVLMDFSLLLLILSLYATLVAFMTGVYATTIHAEPWIAIITLVLCSLLILLMHKKLVIDYMVPAVKLGFTTWFGSIEKLKYGNPL